MEVKGYFRKKTVKRWVEEKVDDPYIGIHLTPNEARQLQEWLSVNISRFNTGMNLIPRQISAQLATELKAQAGQAAFMEVD